MARGLMHLYTGDGKGKTTCSMGLALRFLGHGRRVLIAQYIKNGHSGEIDALRSFENALIADMPQVCKFTFQMTESELNKCRQENDAACARLTDIIEKFKPELTVLDEIAAAVSLGVLGEAAALSVIDAALETGEVCATGFKAPECLIERADYISEIAKRRHPFDKGIGARECVEW